MALEQLSMQLVVILRSTYNIEPLLLLYLLKERNREQDFFHKINKDHNEGLTPDEESGIPVARFVVDRIMEFMDVEKDGKIYLGYVTFYNTSGLVSCGQYIFH
ncbi:hypothetical protein DPMN_102976 [Dreissena polymorpha]|uniref:Uncharacterized protein n=1 Tax=Dreissena polymorpha TaxID=45954 RepID=A0A9D4H727_DREPO|nr:hypothetical protein DPMN_102976 [Dreissena polymorpha]